MQKPYVIHKHSGYGELHYDWMIRLGAELQTWQIAVDPCAISRGRQVSARLIQPHRLAYLTYQGPVSRNRGRVDRVDAGTCLVTWLSDRQIRLDCNGCRIQGRWGLEQIEGPDWKLIRED